MSDFAPLGDTDAGCLSVADVSEGIIDQQASQVIVLRDEIPRRARRLASAASNVALAALFFSELFRGGFAHDHSVSNIIWIAGAAMMGLFALVRIAPKTELVSFATITATGGMMLIPLFMTSEPNHGGRFQHIGEVLELAGIMLTQVSRIYLGRSFGLLPANRGIVSSGPFRLIRHPVYLGWLILTAGFVTVNPSWRNLLVTIAILPFMFARIGQEETLLQTDREYSAYSERTRYRLIPGLY
jgi:protein-S-isoprenylcysteine O-methyltransferase Ste14